MYKILATAIVILMMTGCSALTEKMNQMKCGMMTCVETPVATEEVIG
tara:strand:- start:36 stop:176 length:141 start_codon:yes stop_codon:yes gene_type:complete